MVSAHGFSGYSLCKRAWCHEQWIPTRRSQDDVHLHMQLNNTEININVMLTRSILSLCEASE